MLLRPHDASLSFQQLRCAAFIGQRPEPYDPALRYGGAGRSEDKLRHFSGTPFYQALLPETQNILHHIRRNDLSEETNHG